MNLKRLKKSLACFLGCALALSTVALTPMTAKAEGVEIGDFDTGPWDQRVESSTRIEVTKDAPTTYTFTSVGYGNEPWHTPSIVVYQGNNEVFYGRSDWYGWAGAYNTNWGLPADYSYMREGIAPDGEWQNKQTNASCKVTMQQINDYAVVALDNEGVISIVTIPITGTAYVALSGEKCELKNIKLSTEPADDIDLSSAINKILGGNSGSLELPTVFPTYRQAYWNGLKITEDTHTYVYDSKTYEVANDKWHTPVFVIYGRENGSAGAAGYIEYAVIRSDDAVLLGDVEAGSRVILADDATWLAANKDGAKCTVTTRLIDGYVLIGISNIASNSERTITYAVRVDSAVTDYYLALSGEMCTLSNLQEAQDSEQDIDLTAAEAKAAEMSNSGGNNGGGNNGGGNNGGGSNNNPNPAPAPSVEAVEGGEVLTGTAWWTGMAIGSNHVMSGDGTWTWTVQASALVDGYGAFSVEFYDPATNGYITTCSDKNAWTAEGFNPGGATVSGVPAELASNLVEGHVYAITVTRSGNTLTVRYVDNTEGTEVCTLTITPGETVSNDIQTHVMAQVGTFVTAFNEGSNINTFGSQGRLLGEVLTGTAWWTGMTTGSNHTMSGDGTWTWTIRAASLIDNYGAFSVEIYDPGTNGYITTGSDKNAWTAEGFDPGKATVSGVPAELASKLVAGHTYAVTMTRSGNTFTIEYTDHTSGTKICTLVITPSETMSKDVQTHVMAQVGTFATAFNEGTVIASLGDSVPITLYAMAVIGIAAIAFGAKKRFSR